jgi:Tfp pilus assembly protein PilW
MNALTRLRRRASDDAGLTLSELLVVALLTSLVLAAVGGIYVSTVVAQTTVEGITGASNGGQLVARSIDSAVRNGSEYQITDDGGGQLLVVRSADADADDLGWFCQAWYYTPAHGGSIRSTTTSDGIAIAMPTTAELETWSLLVSGVTSTAGTGIFATDPGIDTVVSIQFETTADGDDSTTIQFSTPLMPGAEGAGTCF